MDEFAYDSPIGPLTLRLREGVITWVGFEGAEGPALPPGHPVREWLDTFFAGTPPPELPLALDVTPFQRAVLEATSGIPRGEVRTYVWVAARVGRPRGARAVGQALGANPIPLVIPCHRVVGSGWRGGYGGGLHRKEFLLALERSRSPGG
ncbi:MAG: methylated-DNA--[protein]-cysteine S-methyltransferase [Actinomycetota bacterium]